jgi:hypothetical protein
MAYEKDLQINTFAVVDDGVNLNHASFGKAFKDYQDGKFFSRTWYNQGADPNNIKGEFPVLIVEQRRVILDCLDSDQYAIPFDFVIVDKLPCDTCDYRSPDKVSDDALVMLRRFFKELLNYRLYSYQKDDGGGGEETVKAWYTEGRMNHLLANDDDVLSINGWDKDLRGMLLTDENITVTQWGNFEKKRGHVSNLTFVVCNSDTGDFEYDKGEPDQISRTICKNC